VSDRRAGRAGWWLAAAIAVLVTAGALVRGRRVPTGSRLVADVNHDGEVRIACLGDSNTALVFAPRKWCEMLQDGVGARGWKTFNYGCSGATITDTGRITPDGAPLYGAPWVARARAEVAPDVVILAYLTNDVLLGIPPRKAVAELERQYDELRAAGLRVLVALCPPFFPREPDHGAAVAEVNRRVRDRFPDEDVIDFFAPMLAADYADDGIHIKDAGQEKRAATALARLEER
jgi:lysophospholipase L1-like esterase